MIIRPAQPSDRERILAIALAIAKDGTTYAMADEADARALWFGGGEVFVAELEGAIAGCYLVRPNSPGRGSHVANAAYMVDPSHQGRGLGRQLAEHSLQRARERGFLAMQFNLVVSTNERAVRAWKDLGFVIVGTLPQAFRHATLGLVDAYVMHRFL